MKAYWLPSIIIFGIACCIAAVAYWFGYESESPYWQGIAVESGGVVLEIALLVILFGLFERRRRKQEHINNLKRRISDFKSLDDDYARAIIASSLRELADLKITEIDFSGSKLTGFSFHNEGIKSLKGSVFASGLWPGIPRNSFGYMRQIDFSWVNCTNVAFSQGNLCFATYTNCNFWNTDLRNADFTYATLEWDAEEVFADESDWSIIEETSDGEPFRSPIYVPAFEEADLDQANFNNCTFYYADFRGAKNILNASFIEAKGLDTCFFDAEIRGKLTVR